MLSYCEKIISNCDKNKSCPPGRQGAANAEYSDIKPVSDIDGKTRHYCPGMAGAGPHGPGVAGTGQHGPDDSGVMLAGPGHPGTIAAVFSADVRNWLDVGILGIRGLLTPRRAASMLIAA